MTQFRAIPIEWGLSDDKYHKFLMWVSFRASFKGWGRCDALQVTFTTREAASRFGVSVSTISGWVGRAKAAGLLLPTNKSAREQGKGEVYDLGGEMLMTVKSTEQEPNNGQTTTEQPGGSKDTAYGAPENNNRTTTEQEPNANKVYSPVSPETPKAGSASRPRKAAGKKDVSQIPPELLIGLQDLCRDWPRWSIRDDGDRQDLRAWSDPVDLWGQMVKHFPDADKALMVECGLAYLDSLLPPPSRYDRKTFVAPKFTYAMTNFYGPVKHHWDKFKEAAKARMEEPDDSRPDPDHPHHT